MRFMILLVIATASVVIHSAAQTVELGVLELENRRLRTHDGRQYQAEVGSFTVPENRSDPDSNVISLGIMRVKSLNPDAGPPIFILAGGPGGSSILTMQDYLNDSDILLDVGDVIAVDQRGVGKSRPVLSRRFVRELPLDEPATREDLLAAYCEVAEEAKAYWREQGVDLSGYTTVEAADDLDAVREALGYESMRLFGRSYGTHLGFSVIRRHGDKVTSAALAGPEGPDHTFKTPKQVDRGLEDLDALVARDPVISVKIPSFLSLVHKVLRRFKKGPVVVDVDLGGKVGVQTIALSKFDVQYWTANNIGRTETLVNVPAAYYAMANDDFRTIAEYVAGTRTVAIVSTMAAVTDCASGMSEERRKRIKREGKRALLGDTVNFPFPDICGCWGVPDLGDEFRSPLRSDVPVLFVCGAYDSRTPVSNALELIPELPNSRLIVVRNAAHDPRLFSSRETVDAVVRFFRDGSVESEIIEMPPFEFIPLGIYR